MAATTSSSSSSSLTSSSSISTTTTPPPPSTTTTPSSSTTSTSSTTTLPTSTTSNTPTSTTVAHSTSNTNTESTSSTSSLSSPASSSQVQTTVIVRTTVVTGTNANGAAFTETILSSSTSLVPTGSVATSSSSSNTGAIAGGVTGGVVAVVALALLLWYCLRKRKRDDFDGNFDPDRVVGSSPGRDGVPLDLDASPYPYNPDSPGVRGPGMPVPQHYGGYNMSQRSDALGAFVGVGAAQSSSSGSHYPPTSIGHSVHDGPLAEFQNVSPGHSLGTVPSTKEREVASERRRLFVNNDPADGSVPFVQHRDGGRVPLDRTPEEQPQEIPPSYDSIDPDDDRPRR